MIKELTLFADWFFIMAENYISLQNETNMCHNWNKQVSDAENNPPWREELTVASQHSAFLTISHNFTLSLMMVLVMMVLRMMTTMLTESLMNVTMNAVRWILEHLSSDQFCTHLIRTPLCNRSTALQLQIAVNQLLVFRIW